MQPCRRSAPQGMAELGGGCGGGRAALRGWDREEGDASQAYTGSVREGEWLSGRWMGVGGWS